MLCAVRGVRSVPSRMCLMSFVLNHLVNGAVEMSQSEFPMWVPLWHGVNEAGYYGAKSPCNTHQKTLGNASKSKLGSGKLLSKELKV